MTEIINPHDKFFKEVFTRRLQTISTVKTYARLGHARLACQIGTHPIFLDIQGRSR